MTDKIIRVKIEAGESERLISDLDAAMVKAGASADGAVKKTEQLSDSLAKIAPVTNQAGKVIELMGVRLSEADIALGRFIDKTGRVHEATGQFTAGILASGESVKDFATKVNTANGVNTELTKTAKGVKDAVAGGSDSLGNFGRSAGMAGVQFQQFIGQVQGGVNPMVALSQQAADLGFALGVPLLGSIVAIGASVGLLAGAFNQAEDSADKFKESLKEIEQAQEEFKANKAQAQIAELNNEFDKQQKTIESLKRQQAQYVELLQQSGTNQTAYAAALFQVDRALESAAEKQADLSKKIEETTAASLSGKAATDEQASTLQNLNSSLEAQRIRLEDGELAARLYAAAQQLSLSEVKNLPPEIAKNIEAIYNLEQAQKAQKESAAELVRITREQEQAEKVKARQEEDAARRAERDKQRINERIANMRLETQTMAAESELQRAVMEGRFSAEDAQAAERFASKVLQATTEYQTLLDLANNDKERQLEAEAIFQERLAAIKQQYADQQDQITANSNYAQYQYAQQLQNIQMDTASNALSALSSFAKQGSGVQKALFLALKGIQAAQAYTSGLTAAMLARATIPYPASEPIALAQITAGKVSAAAIMATGIAGTFSGGGGGSIGGGSIPSSASATMPTTPQAAATVNTLEIVGLTELKDELRNNDGMVSTRFVASILDKIEDANRLRGQA